MKWFQHIFGGLTRGRTMAALERGTTAPDFTSPAMDGTQFSLGEALVCELSTAELAFDPTSTHPIHR